MTVRSVTCMDLFAPRVSAALVALAVVSVACQAVAPDIERWSAMAEEIETEMAKVIGERPRVSFREQNGRLTDVTITVRPNDRSQSLTLLQVTEAARRAADSALSVRPDRINLILELVEGE